MKVLSLSHMCIPEFFTNKDGEKEKFFSGPSPDEVALVQFASIQGFDCIESNDDEILARFRKSNNSMEVDMDEASLS